MLTASTAEGVFAFHASAPSSCLADQPCALLLTSLNRSLQAHFHALLAGPALLLGRALNLGQGRYELSWAASDPGPYRPRLTLSFLDDQQALPADPRLAHRGCLCAPLHAHQPLAISLLAPPAPSPPVALPPCPAWTWPRARWLRGPSALGRPSDADYRWTPYACALRDYPPGRGAACLARLRLLLLGDSHLRLLGEALAALHGALAVDYVPVKGIYPVARPPLYFALNATPPEPAVREPLSPVLQWLASAEGRAQLAAADVVLLCVGHWELRDGPVAGLVADLRALLAAWPPPPPAQRRVWLTIPAFSYRGRFGHREYRTNEKIEAANALLGPVLSDGGFLAADLWALTAPLYQATCDSHHYLCGNRTATFVGQALLRSLLNMICAEPP